MNTKEISGKRQMEFLAGFDFVREAGTAGEVKAAKMIRDTLDSFGVKNWMEEFSFWGFRINRAVLKVVELLRLEEIGYFEYLKDKRQWQVALFNQTRLNLKRNTKAEDIIGYSQAFIQISQSAIVNVNYLAMIDGKCCQLYPPFHDKSDLIISRSFLKGLQDRFFVL